MSSNKKRLFRALAVLLALLSSAAFAEADPGADFYTLYDDNSFTINRDADLVVGYTAADYAGFNPFACVNRDLLSLGRLCFESVVDLDDNFQPVPLLADSWTHEGKNWAFKLRQGIVFHNGTELTGADVVSSYQRIVAAGKASPYYSRISLIREMQQAEDDPYTVYVKGEYSGYITLYAMTFPIVETSTQDDAMARGTGPYWITQISASEGIRFERNPLWWKKDPILSSVVALRYGDTADLLAALHAGEISLLTSRSGTVAYSRKLSDFTSLDYATNTFEVLVPNLSDSHFLSDLNLRKAVMYAIDTSVVTSNGYLGMGVQCEVPVNPNSWLYESQSAVYYYSPERAYQLVLESGWKDLTGDGLMNKVDGIHLQDLTLSLITYNDPTNSVRENAANLIAMQLKRIGITVKVTALTQEKCLSRISKGDYDIALVGMNLSEVPNLAPMLNKGGSLNLNGINSETLQGLLTSAASAQTAEELKAVYSDIQLYLVDNLPVMGVCFRTGTILSSHSLSGLTGMRESDMLRGIVHMNP